MRYLLGLFYIAFSLILIYGCNGDEKQAVSLADSTEKNSSDKETEKELLALSAEIFSLLQESDFINMADKVDPEDGITFAFYADFGNPDGYGGQYVHLSKEKISAATDREYVWGHDESGKEYQLTLHEYVQQMLLQRWGKEEVDYNIITFNEPAENFAGVINTIHTYYPDAKYVEYYSPGKDEHSFQSIRFIYKEREGDWYLIGIARDVATV